MSRWQVLALAVAVVTATTATPPAFAGPKVAKAEKKDKKQKAKKDKKDKDADADKDDSSDSDDSDSSDDDDKKKPKAKAKAKDDDKDKDDDKPEKSDDKSDKKDDGGGGGGGGDDEGGGEGGGEGDKDKAEKPAEEPVKQDLNGHDLGSKKKANEFERDRFFVDKHDTEATEKKTLVQGSLTSSSFFFREGGGTYPMLAGATSPGANNSTYSRYFTDLRLQTDFRHIAASRWDARVDTRVRFVNTPDAPTGDPGAPTPYIQSGLNGKNEYEIRELWLIRNGERTDVTLGRQFITDLAAVKVDGLRIDYASSSQLTYLGFAGLYPLRGSRSLTTDYIDLKDPADPTKSAGKFVGSGGFGAAYRTPAAYGSFGGVVLVPFQVEQPRVFATANGYYRLNPKVDLYHFALIDLISSYGAQITNFSGGVNYKPSQRLRMTASYNRVDTDSLNIQAAAFFDAAQGNAVVQNEIALQRLASNIARGSVSAGLGNLQRVEITMAMAYRYRAAFTLAPVGAAMGTQLPAAKGVDVYGSITDRRSFKDARIGIDVLKSFGVGTVAYQRDEVTAIRGFVGRELADGHGEWEAEVAYSTTQDVNGTMSCTTFVDCFGQTSGSVLSLGGTLYYRVNRDWLLIGQAFLSRTDMTTTGQAADPTITGLSGYFRAAYRF